MGEIRMPEEKYLYEKLLMKFGEDSIKSKDIDKQIIENLNPNFPFREYQKEAFQMFKCYFENDFNFKTMPNAVLFNMATGSGKTLIMAGLIIYLYKKGYRNFLFFVNSNNIIEKTKDNFIKFTSSKYLFNEKLVFDGKRINMRVVDNFDTSNGHDINICFTTIQKLHGDLHLDKENSMTFESFKEKKIVLLADEAHHGQVKTKQRTLTEKPNWENTIERILEKDKENLLLEFTATMGFENNSEVHKKYLDRLLYKYDLKEFVKNGFSKDIEIFKVDADKKYRMLIAVLINQYRQDIANKYGLKNFKPVILFKAQKEIKESINNHLLFRDIIDNLKVEDINKIKKKANEKILKKLFEFYSNENISINNLIKKIQINFAESKCLNVNEESLDKISISKKDKEEVLVQQNILNSLEDKNNQKRVIFAVHKLNEGWDVLNLFDIVRIASKQAGGGGYKGRVSPSTISEAQLIGRGARYFPFALDETQERYKRKYDEDLDFDLRLLEELYFHSFNESRYISELKQALVEKGLMDDKTEEKKLELKEEFKQTLFYKSGKIYLNKKIKKNYRDIKSFEQLGFIQKDFEYEIFSGRVEKTEALTDVEYDNAKIIKTTKTIKISSIDKHIIKNALSKIDFFNFEGISRYFPSLTSSEEIIQKKSFLAKMNIRFLGIKEDLEEISNRKMFNAVYNLLTSIKDVLKNNIIEYEGSKEFMPKQISKIFLDKTLKLEINSPKYKGHKNYIKDKNWYVFNENYGTSEEKDCVEFIGMLIDENLSKKYNEIYFIRNELHFKIHNFKDGQSFAPDFVLFLKSKNGEEIHYQIFIEPKNPTLAKAEPWKEDFLKEIRKNAVLGDLVKFTETKNYILTGVKFYNKIEENKFKDDLLNEIKN